MNIFRKDLGIWQHMKREIVSQLKWVTSHFLWQLVVSILDRKQFNMINTTVGVMKDWQYVYNGAVLYFHT
jgi:hypothetical protein